MKPSKKRAFLLVLLLLAIAAFGFAFPSDRGKAMDERVASESQMTQANAQGEVAREGQRCEWREVNADEGYGVSHKEIRRVCR